ncbi:MAG: oligosaccharide flippase family protein [Chthoniobacterales bacterium]|nr:oligosaccharide flippase family protein [Gemmatimonadaceae bacterium]MBA3831451.1 oligosaccharide flippase family protein [Chthoniobacterales bacterium]
MSDPQPALGDGLTGAELEDAEHADLLKRSIRGANVLLVRGLLLRVISASTNFALIALVLPAELGIFAVVRGALATVQFTTELGFELAMIRRRENPTPEMLAAVAGLRTMLLVAILVLAMVIPHASDLFGVLPKEWSSWLLVAIAAMLVTPIQTSCKVALERDLRFAELSLLEVKGIFIQNIALVAFAFAHKFVVGVFVTQIALCFYYTIALYRLVPIRRISFNLRPVRALAGDSIGFSTSTLVTVARDSLTPILIARFFGLDVAGLWNFAWRIGQFLSLTFEGYLRAGVAASSRLAARMESLRELAESTLRGAAQIAFPIVALAYAFLPLLALLLPKWSGAVVMAQLYVLTLGVAGVYTAALSPVALALRGPRAAMAEQTTATVMIWGALVVLKLSGIDQVAWAYAAGLIAAAGVVYALTKGIRVPVVQALSKPLGLLALSLAVSFGGMALHVSPWIVAPLAAIVPAFVLGERAWAGRSMIPAALRELRGGGDREPATSGAA